MAEDLFNFPEGTETPIRDARYPNIIDFDPMENYEEIRKELLRSDELYVDDTFGDEPWIGVKEYGHFEWRRPRLLHHDPQFRPRSGKPSRFDCLQGNIGDCWLMASIESMTLDEDLFEHIVPADQSFDRSIYCGAFHFRIWHQGNWYDVVVDDRIPVFKATGGIKGATSATGDVFWGMLLEKAMAKFISVNENTIPSYINLEEGQPTIGMQNLSGGITERIRLGKDVIERVPDHMGKSLRDLMLESFERKDMMVVGIKDVEEKDADRFTSKGLLPQHSYSVSKVVWFDPQHKHYSPDFSFDKVKDICLVRLLNPWGWTEWQGAWSDKSDKWGDIFSKIDDHHRREFFGAPIKDEGEFWMELSDFATMFQWLYVCNLEPTGFLLNRNIYIDYKTWHTVEVRGEWVEGLSAVGPDITTRHKNPQFLFQFEDPVPDVEEYKRCKSVIDLTDRSATRDDGETHASFVYFGIRDKLTQADLQEHSPENENLHFQYDNSNWQSFLVPGRFIVIPCTMEPKIDSKFLLRIFSPCPLKYIVGDAGSRISKPLHLEEQSNLESNAIPMRMFIDSAQGNSEIDWVELKEILEEAFNPNGSFFGMFLTFLKNVQDYFDPNPLRSSDEYGNDSVIFTKDECRRMIAMLDEDHSGKLNISEFCNLWKHICFWIKVYDRYKDEEKGYLKTGQLRDALGAIGYDVNTRILHTVSYVYSNQEGAISYTDFILCGVSLETTLSLVEKTGVEDKSKITFTLEEWVKKTLIL